MDDSFNYSKLFWTTLYFNSVTFGGGYVIIPLLVDKYVNDYHWLEEEEIMSLISIAQSAPGPFAVNASVLIGFRMAGWRGALVSGLGSVLPAFVLMTVASYLYDYLTQFEFIENILLGMSAGVAAIITDVVLKMINQTLSRKDGLTTLLMFASIIAAIFLDVSVIIILLVGALFGLSRTVINSYSNEVKK